MSQSSSSSLRELVTSETNETSLPAMCQSNSCSHSPNGCTSQEFKYSSTNKPQHGNSNRPILHPSFLLPMTSRVIRSLLLKLAKHRTGSLCLLIVLVQMTLSRLAYRQYTYSENVKFNRRTLSTSDPPDDAWWHGQKLTIFTVWIGKDASPPPVIEAAMQSCHNAHKDEENLSYRVITNDDLKDSKKLGFELHPSFWLLDNVEKSDYLRGELLHHHGGFYMDADMLCLRSFSNLLLNNFVAGAAQDRTKYGPWPSVSQNAFGPFQPQSELTTAWHTSLMKTMNDITPKLQQCAARYAPDPIPYPSSRRWGTSLCGTRWGQIIDFCKPIWKEYTKVRQQFGHDLSMCDGDGRHLGWDDYGILEKCDVIHLGTSGDFYLRKQWDMQALCEGLPVMRGSMHCASSSLP